MKEWWIECGSDVIWPLREVLCLIIPLYKRKAEKTECKNCKGISLVSIVGKNMCGDLSRKCK